MIFSIVICTYNRKNLLKETLNSLIKQSFDHDLCEILIVDNNSTDGTENICSDFIKDNPGIHIRYVLEENAGLSYARNRGIKEAQAELISFIDDDVIVSRTYASEVINFFKNHPTALALGGKILPNYESEKPKWMSVFLEPLMSVIDLGKKERIFPKGKFPVGANMIFKKDVFDKIGLFNTNLGRKGKNMLGGEEKDIFNRINKIEGEVWYSPKPWIYHYVPDNRLTKDFIKKQALGIGFSEKVRAKDIGAKELIISGIKELIKWGATILLFFFYGLKFQPVKGVMIIRFRYWVSSGFFKHSL